MRKGAAFTALLCLATPAVAHDFWIEFADMDAAGQDAALTAFFKVGTAAEPEDWNLRRERIVALRSFGPGGVTDQQAEIVAGQPGSAKIRLAGEGTHIVTLETAPAESDLPAGQFNDYVEHEGLTAVRDWRIANGKANENGRETYARRAKAIVQLGTKLSDGATQRLGLSLEVVPELHPFALGQEGKLPVRLYFRGKPLAGAHLDCESLDGVLPPAQSTTDAEGRAACTIKRKGRWKISTVWSVPISGNDRAEFDTLFSSLTFGY